MAGDFNVPKHALTARRTRTAGWFIVVLAAGAGMLPLVQPAHGAGIISALLISAGIAEIAVGTMRHQTRKLAILAGVATTIAGIVFFADAAAQFLPRLIIVMGWLFLRSLLLATACVLESGSVQLWTGLSAATDFVLALSLAIGLSISTLIVSLFGATPELIASFSWLLAISFMVTGVLLLEVAQCGLKEDV